MSRRSHLSYILFYILMHTSAQCAHQEGDNSKTLEQYDAILALDAHNFEAAFNAANLAFSEKAYTRAINYYKQALQVRPNCHQIHYNIGVCHQKNLQYWQAIYSFDEALAYHKQYTQALLQKAAAYESLNNHAAAVAIYETILSYEPATFALHIKIGKALRHIEKFEDCVAHFRKAVEMEPRNPTGLLELANTLNMWDESEECCELYKKVLEITPQSLGALYNYGYTLKKLGQVSEAITIYDKVLARDPNYSAARFSRALAYLTLGDFEHGWQEYEWRWKAYNTSQPIYKEPLKDITNVNGKRIFIYAEQGLGDTFQFIRYAKLLKERGAIIIFKAQQPLKTLLSLCPYIDHVVTNGDQLPPFDVSVALMSLPLLFNTTITNVPVDIPYIYADPALEQLWHTKLAEDKNFKIGICWQGNANYSTQFLRQVVAAKSMELTNFAPLGKIPGVSIYSLQKVFGEDQIKSLNGAFELKSFGDDFDESHGRFMDTVAVIKNLDLVVTVDTSIAHCAAALGVQVFMPLPKPADWRWLLDRDDTPWYPNMRLFRQTEAGQWTPIMEEIAQEITALLVNKGHINA